MKSFIKSIFKKEHEFKKTKHSGQFILRNQEKEIYDCSEEDLINFLDGIYNDDSEFIVLTPPSLIQDVAYIQAIYINGKMEIQLGIDKNNKTYLYYKKYDFDEGRDIFLDFYNHHEVPSRKGYKPLKM